MWGPSYLGLTRSISWLLMPWLLTSPEHQQPWYWLCRICRLLSYLRKDFNYMPRINVDKWHKMYMFMFPLTNLARKGLTFQNFWTETAWTNAIQQQISNSKPQINSKLVLSIVIRLQDIRLFQIPSLHHFWCCVMYLCHKMHGVWNTLSSETSCVHRNYFRCSK